MPIAARDLPDGSGRRRRERARVSSCRCCRRTTSSSTAATRTITTTSRGRAALAASGLHYVDMGTSGGVWGLERGYCLMIGGEPEPVQRLDPIFAYARSGQQSRHRTPGRDRQSQHRTIGLSALWTRRRRALCEDDPQRHRVRVDGRVCGGPQHPATRQRRQRRLREHDAETTPLRIRSTISTTSSSPTSPRYGVMAA